MRNRLILTLCSDSVSIIIALYFLLSFGGFSTNYNIFTTHVVYTSIRFYSSSSFLFAWKLFIFFNNFNQITVQCTLLFHNTLICIVYQIECVKGCITLKSFFCFCCCCWKNFALSLCVWSVDSKRNYCMINKSHALFVVALKIGLLKRFDIKKIAQQTTTTTKKLSQLFNWIFNCTSKVYQRSLN